jgi:hypothetical protein
LVTPIWFSGKKNKTGAHIVLKINQSAEKITKITISLKGEKISTKFEKKNTHIKVLKKKVKLKAFCTFFAKLI